MFGVDVHQLRVWLQHAPSTADTLVFDRQGNYGDNWNYGQVTLNLTTETTVSDITQEVHSLTMSLILISCSFCPLMSAGGV